MTEFGAQPMATGPTSPERRRFLTWLGLGLSALIGALLGIPVLGFLLSPLIKSPSAEWIDVGSVESYEIGDTRLVPFTSLSPLPWAGLTAKTAIYVRRTGQVDFTVFSVHCTHLGCPVNWLPTANLFICPCHGGVYYRDGTVAAGPPPRPLWTYTWRVTNGHLFVQTQPLPPAPPKIF